MKTIPDSTLSEIVRRLAREFDPERIILFGSHALPIRLSATYVEAVLARVK
jgi:hypothetical protein